MCGVFTGAAATRSRSGLGQGLSTLRSQRAWQNFLLPPNSRLFRQNCLYSTSAFLNKVRHCVWYPLACGWFFVMRLRGERKEWWSTAHAEPHFPAPLLQLLPQLITHFEGNCLLSCLWPTDMVPNSKHRFTTSFLQPLPYLVTPQVPENCQLTSSFFVGAQTVVSLLQTTQIKQGVSFITVNKVCTSTNKTTIVWIETELLLFLPGVDTSHVYVRALVLGCFYSHISTRTFRRALTASLDSCAEIKSAPSLA